MNELVTKSLGATGVEVKDPDRGEVEAVVARVGVVDRDGDLFLKGSFGTRDVRVSEFNHRSWPQRGGDRPIGRGTIQERGDEVVASMKFFMKTTAGREAFEVVKELAEQGQWSYGWIPGEEREAELTDDLRSMGARRAIKSVPVVEVSPVLMGASIGTRTTSAKCDRCSTAAAPGAAAPVTPELRALVAVARENLEEYRADPFPAVEIPQRDPESKALGEFAAYVGRMLARRTTGRDAPRAKVKWFVRTGRNRDSAGFIFESVKDETWIAADLRGERLIQAVLHETVHHHQYVPALARGISEPEADAFAAKWAGTVHAAYRATKGRAYRVSITADRRPPFGMPGDYRTGDVVLACRTGRAWMYTPMNNSAWSAL